MDEGNVRKVRLEQLLYQQKRKEVVQYGVLFDECVIALGEGTIILSDEKSEVIYDYLQASYPITSWARIDWEQVNYKIKIDNINVTEAASEILKVLGEVNEEIFILWSHGNQPVLISQLSSLLKEIDVVLAVSPDTFVICPTKYIIEFYHEGEITIGFENKLI